MSYRRFQFREIANAPATLATLATVRPKEAENTPSVASVANVAGACLETSFSQDGLVYLFEERAAILEYSDGLCREEAEALARIQVYGEALR